MLSRTYVTVFVCSDDIVCIETFIFLGDWAPSWTFQKHYWHDNLRIPGPRTGVPHYRNYAIIVPTGVKISVNFYFLFLFGGHYLIKIMKCGLKCMYV